MYCCKAGPYQVPWEVKQKLKGQYTHRVAEAMCRTHPKLIWARPGSVRHFGKRSGYFEKPAERMQYKAFRESGYQIGTCCGQRCKQASMRWEKPGINAVLSGRCLLKNDVWDIDIGIQTQMLHNS